MITKLYVKNKHVSITIQERDERRNWWFEYGLIAVAMAVLVTTAVGADGFIAS